MDAALKKCDADWKHVEKKGDTSRTDATFTEIYELIYYNQTLVRSELVVLLQLIQKKHREKVWAAPAGTANDMCETYGKKTATTQIRPVLK